MLPGRQDICTKCHRNDIYIRWHAAVEHCSECHEVEECDAAGCPFAVQSREHLRLVCRSCGYTWYEPTI